MVVVVTGVVGGGALVRGVTLVVSEGVAGGRGCEGALRGTETRPWW